LRIILPSLFSGVVCHRLVAGLGRVGFGKPTTAGPWRARDAWDFAFGEWRLNLKPTGVKRGITWLPWLAIIIIKG